MAKMVTAATLAARILGILEGVSVMSNLNATPGCGERQLQ
jgi:hypothetical protein